MPLVVAPDPAADLDRPTARLRLAAPPTPEDRRRVYGAEDGWILSRVLHRMDGIVSIDTPSLQYGTEARWSNAPLPGTNQEIVGWTGSPEAALSATFRYALYDVETAVYAAACAHWFRTAPRLHTGARDPLAGLPADYVLLSAAGDHVLNRVPVVVTRVSFSMEDGTSLVPVDDPDTGRTLMVLPVTFEVQVQLTVVRAPVRRVAEFDLRGFRDGTLLVTEGWA